MANKSLFKYIGVCAAGAALLAAPGCTDTWDDHYDDLGTSASQTLWEQIQADPNLSKFADIARKANYYRDDIHPVVGYTFADILNSAQVNTVWVPDNSAISDADYAKYMDMAEHDGYNLQTQLFSNHIARWRWVMTDSKIDTLFMVNDKQVFFDKGQHTIGGVSIEKANVMATNGTLHVIKGIIPFRYNLYQYMKFSGEVGRLHDYLVEYDTTYFSESNSIEGMPDENGNPTYVDSVYLQMNRLYSSYADDQSALTDKLLIHEKGVGAYFSSESSEYIMMMPTDAAYDAAYEMLKPGYQYAPLYIDRLKSTNKSTETREVPNADSLQDLSIKTDLFAHTMLNLQNQGRVGGEEGAPWDLEEFIQKKGEGGEYLYTTRGDTLRSTDTWDKSEFLTGTPVELSNGYAILTDKWNLPREFYRPDVDIKFGYEAVYTATESLKARLSYKTFTNANYAAVADTYGKISRDYFYMLSGQGASDNPECEIRLRGSYSLAYNPSAYVQSGKYDVYMILVPYWYSTISDLGEIDDVYLDQHYVDSIAQLQKVKMRLAINYDDGSRRGKTTSNYTVEYVPTKVDTVLCIPNMEFPYSYQNMIHSYPLLSIKGAVTTSDARKGYIRQICIDRIILKSKEDGSVIEVDPS